MRTASDAALGALEYRIVELEEKNAKLLALVGRSSNTIAALKLRVDDYRQLSLKLQGELDDSNKK